MLASIALQSGNPAQEQATAITLWSSFPSLRATAGHGYEPMLNAPGMKRNDWPNQPVAGTFSPGLGRLSGVLKL